MTQAEKALANAKAALGGDHEGGERRVDREQQTRASIQAGGQLKRDQRQRPRTGSGPARCGAADRRHGPGDIDSASAQVTAARSRPLLRIRLLDVEMISDKPGDASALPAAVELPSRCDQPGVVMSSGAAAASVLEQAQSQLAQDQAAGVWQNP